MHTFQLDKEDTRYYFTLRNRQGEVLAESIRFATRRHALDAIEQMRRHAGSAPTEDLTGEAHGNSRS